MGEISLPLARHKKKKIRTNKSAKPTESYIIQCTARFAISTLHQQLLNWGKEDEAAAADDEMSGGQLNN